VIHRILASLDGGPGAADVLNAAVQMGARFRASVRPFRVVPVVPRVAAQTEGNREAALSARLAQQALEDIVRLASGIIAAEIDTPVVRLGDPTTLVLEACAELSIDLLVLGRGSSRPDATASQLARRAACSVLLVRHEDKRQCAQTLTKTSA
jgi:nucleotide-binding universal stress UspA family protein